MPARESKKRYFPGLMPVEADIWRAWLTSHELEYDRFAYNYRIGPGVDAVPESLADDPELQAKLAKQFYEATQHRIDVVGYKGPAVTIFEVEGRGGSVALGQLLTYGELWKQYEPVRGPLYLRLVAYRLSPGMDVVFRRSGIRIDIVPQPPAELP